MRRRDTETHTGGRQPGDSIEAETRVSRPQVKEHLEPPEAGRRRKGSSPRDYAESVALRTP